MVNRRVVLRSRPAHVPQPDNFEIVLRRGARAGRPGRSSSATSTSPSSPPSARAWTARRRTCRRSGSASRSRARPWDASSGPTIPTTRRARSSSASTTGRTTSSSATTPCCSTACRPRRGCRSPTTSARWADRAPPPMSGCTTIGEIQAGETVVISAAAGGVGSVAGQIARLRGCRVVGLVGSADKAAVVKDRLGFDAVINYREVPDLAAAVARPAPMGWTCTTTTWAARRWTRCS